MSPVLSRIGRFLGSWKWVLGYTALLLLTLGQTRWLLDGLAERNLSGLLGVFLFVAGVGCLFLLLRRIHRVRGGFTPSTLLRLLGVLALYLCCMFTSTDLTVDRIHFVEYGILGILCFRAVDPRHRRGRRVGYALVAVFAIGLLDECIQGVLDDRYFDLRDIVIDLLGGFLPVLGLLWLPLHPAGAEERVEPAPAVWGQQGPSRAFRATDAGMVLFALFLLLCAVWVGWVSWDPEPLYGEWERENRCGRFERMRIGGDGTILWEDAEGGRAVGRFRIRGNRLDGPLLDVDVLEGQGSDPCAWTTGERRHRYFRIDAEGLVFAKERGYPFRRDGPAPDL